MLKRVFLAILALIMVFSCFACGNKGGKNETAETDAPTGKPADDKDVTLSSFMTYSYDKQLLNVKPKIDEATEFTVSLAKGESEGCQFGVWSTGNLYDVYLTLESTSGEAVSVKTFSMEYPMEIRRKDWQDPLVPYENERRLDVEAKRYLSFMADFTTTVDTPAGDYEFVYTLRNRSGEALETFTVKVHVYDVVLPEKKTFETAFGISRPYLAAQVALYNDYYDILLEHGLCAYELPYDILDERADAYMSDPRVTAFWVPAGSTAEIQAYYNKLKTNPEWLAKAYYYPIDEPRTMAHLEEYKEHCERIQAIAPGLRVVAPFYTNIEAGGMDQTSHMAPHTNLWCPKLCLWDDVNAYEDVPNYTGTSFADRMAAEQAGGDGMWTYVCNDPEDPYSQLFIDTEGVNQRSVFWQTYQRNIEGFLYWSVTYWKGMTRDSWQGCITGFTDSKGTQVYGEGVLIYPGKQIGLQTTPIPTVRLKIVRDGVEDIELFYLAEQYLGKDWIMSKTMEVTPSLTEYSVDADGFNRIRNEIYTALEQAMNNN